MRVKMVKKKVLNPLSELDNIEIDLNPFPHDFNTVALVDNTKPGADHVLRIIKNALGNREFMNITKPAGAAATPQQIEKISEAEIAILALGDCGSCTTWVVLDAIRLERKGVPTLSLCTDYFGPFAHELAKSHGMSNLRILLLKHPLASESPDIIEKRVLQIIPQINYLLQIP